MTALVKQDKELYEQGLIDLRAELQKGLDSGFTEMTLDEAFQHALDAIDEA